jgi:F-type H+-transporting ATPase subunit delta
MTRGSAPKRYAQALAQIAQERGAWEQWSRDLAAVDRLMQNRTLSQYLRNPRIAGDDKVETLRQVAEDQLSPEAMNLLRLLIARGQSDLAREIVVWFERLADEARSVQRVQVTTAVPLGDAEREALRRRLAGHENRPVRLTEAVDPAIIGGVVLRIGDELIDSSLRTRLVAMRSALMQN